jgi:hypothetical protein
VTVPLVVTFGLKTAKRITAITLERPLEITLCLVD